MRRLFINSNQRQWGLTTLPNGKKAFYTKAADRAFTSGFVKLAGNQPWAWNCDDDTYYNIANATWVNLVTKAGQFIRAGGGIVPGIGSNVIYHVAKARIDYQEMNNKLKSNSPVSFIYCD